MDPIGIHGPEAHGGRLSDLTVRLSKLGASGKHPSNIERDLYRVLDLSVPLFWVDIPIREQQNRSSIQTEWMPMILPHQLYHYIFET